MTGINFIRLNYTDLRWMQTAGYDKCRQCNSVFVFDDLVFRRGSDNRSGHAGKSFYYHKLCWEKLFH